MKYTKYQYKKKNQGAKFFSSLIMTTLAAVIIGLIGALVLLKFIPNIGDGNVITDDPAINANSNTDAMEQQVQEQKFIFIQCGYFSKEDNANQALAKVQNGYDSFIVEDDTGKFKILVGVANQDEVSKTMDELKAKGIENAKISLTLNKNNKIQGQISGITEGYLQIINTSSQNDVKEVNLSDFKEWINGLEEITEGEGIEVLKEYKEHINSLPETINKENITSELQYVYLILNKINK